MSFLLVQWTLVTPQDWETVDISNIARWRQTPDKGDPTADPDPVIDDQPGWVFALGFQGITFSADHYAVRNNPDGPGIQVITINDDPVDWPPGWRHAFAWTLRPLRPWRGGGVNTDQSLVVFAEDQAMGMWPQGLRTTAGDATFLPWAEFEWPNKNLVRHGVQVSDALATAHNAARSPIDYRDWQ